MPKIPGITMSHWRSGTFWASLIFGWFITMVGIAVLFRMFVADLMSPAMDWVLVISQQVLSLAAGYAYGREQFNRRERKQVGFSVIQKRDGESSAPEALAPRAAAAAPADATSEAHRD